MSASPAQVEATHVETAQVEAWIAATARRRAAERERDRRRAAWLARMPGARRAAPTRIIPAGERIAPGAWAEAAVDPWAGLTGQAHVLWLQPDHLGDVLLRGPALSALRARLPRARITLAVGPWSRAVAAALPGVDELRTLPFPAFARRPAEGPRRGFGRLAPYAQLLRHARCLRRRRFDAVVVGRDDDAWSAWLAALAGIPLRIGHAHPALDPFLTHALAPRDRPAHVAAASLSLVAAPEPTDARRHPLALTPAAEARRQAEDLLRGAHDLARSGSDRLVAIHPGSGSPIKRWQPAGWARLVHALPNDCSVLLTGGPAERGLTQAVARAIDATRDAGPGTPRAVLDLAGRTTVAQLAALFARCALVVGPDSGPLHLAVATGTPTLHLYGPADADRFGPWGSPERHRALAAPLACAPCGIFDWPDLAHHACVHAIASRSVLSAARDLLDS